jgi:hypothetical protein
MGAVAQLAAQMVQDPMGHIGQFEKARAIFGDEKANFDKEVTHTFAG